MQNTNIQRVRIEVPGGAVLRFRNAEFIPAFYFIPESFLLKCGQELCSIPRDFNQLIVDQNAIRLVASDLFLECIVDCYAYMAWPYLCPDIPYMEILSGYSPAWKIAHAAPIWIDELTRTGILPTFADLFRKPKETLYFGFVPIEEVSLHMSIIVPSAVKRHDLQVVLDTEKEYRCFEDFDYRESNQKIDFVRKWYHTRTKHPQVSLEGYQEHCKQYYDDIEWEIPDPISSFEEEVEARVDVNKFLSKIKDKDKQILQMRAEGYTNQEIADRIGYKTHSAVVKRIKKLGKMYQESSGLNFGFYLMVVFDTSSKCMHSTETARNGLFSGLFCFYGGLHHAAPSRKIGRMAVHLSASATPTTARAKEKLNRSRIIKRYGNTKRYIAITAYACALSNHPELSREREELILERKHAPRTSTRYLQAGNRLTQIKKALQEEEKRAVSEARFVATTVSKAIADKILFEDRFDTVIFDEASMAFIPQIVFSAGLADRHFVCMGDFAQLPPIVQGDDESTLNVDIFRYCGIVDAVEAGYGHEWLCMLDTQYRMHPDIAAFSSRTMYRGLLKSALGMREKRELITRRAPFKDHPIGVVDLSGMMSVCTRTADQSRINVLSAMISMGIALRAATHSEVGVITPYNAQSRLLHAMTRDIAERYPNLQRITCATVHQFQGSEKDVIVYDAVDCYRICSRKPRIRGTLMENHEPPI